MVLSKVGYSPSKSFFCHFNWSVKLKITTLPSFLQGIIHHFIVGHVALCFLFNPRFCDLDFSLNIWLFKDPCPWASEPLYVGGTRPTLFKINDIGPTHFFFNLVHMSVDLSELHKSNPFHLSHLKFILYTVFSLLAHAALLRHNVNKPFRL